MKWDLLGKRKCVLLLSIISIIYVIHICTIEEYPQLQVQTFYFNKTRSPYQTILYWNSFFGDMNYFGSGQDIFKDCPVSSCYLTSNRSYVDIEFFDAIIFHSIKYKTYIDGFPKKRNIHQKYIFYGLESPINTMLDERTFHEFYNWTMTYRLDSDIFSPYARVIETETNYSYPKEDEIRNKTRSIAWFVSNCHSNSGRENFVKELSKYIDVDIFGKCGTKNCSRKNSDQCYKMIERDYRFYLSLENSLCDDYVTEKLYNILRYDVVPIVLDKLGNYRTLAPPNSVINASGFKDVQLLVNYLKFLSTNVSAYLEFFRWKKKYKIISPRRKMLCDMCQKLNQKFEKTVYNNIKTWWYGEFYEKCIIKET